VVAACSHCHALLDGVDQRIAQVGNMYPAALHMRYLNALVETQAMLAAEGIIVVPDGEIV
jgi:hypothetical protein